MASNYPNARGSPFPAYLLVPSVRPSDGSGHVKRCLSLAAALGPKARVFIPKSDAGRSAAEIRSAFPDKAGSCTIVESIDPRERWDTIILDRRASTAEEYAFFDARGFVVGLDEGGSLRDAFPFLVDALGHPPGTKAANVADTGLLELPRNQRDFPETIKSVIISFGGVDLQAIGPLAARFLIRSGMFPPDSITVQRGALSAESERSSRSAALPEGVRDKPPSPKLGEELARYDLVVTQYGLTAFEAAYAGCAVLLVSPTGYHRRLARNAGFAELGDGNRLGVFFRRGGSSARKRLEKFLSADVSGSVTPTRVLVESNARTAPSEAHDLAGLISGLDSKARLDCPICGSNRRRAVARYPMKSYFRCRSCGILWMSNVRGQKNSYGKEYFFEEYRRQYGKTYLDDFPNLLALAEKRLDVISRFLSNIAAPTILDVGCAYGAFLSAASRSGFSPFGVDVSEEAIAYVNGILGVPAAVSSFESFTPDGPGTRPGIRFDAVTMWYVIEHLPDLGKALAKVNALLKPGGIFAFSTPSGEGVSARTQAWDFFEKSPDDHVTVWEPSRCFSVLSRFGFRIEKTIVTGHHPERFPFVSVNSESGTGSVVSRAVAGAMSVLFRLGDTFEAYAVKVREV